MGRLSFQTTVKTKQLISVKRTVQLTGVGFSFAAFIVGFFLFGQSMMESADVKANNKNKSDTLVLAPNSNRGDSLVNTNSGESGIHSEDANHLLTDEDLAGKKARKKSNGGGDRSQPYHDLVSISPKQTTGVFEVNFEVPVNKSGKTSMELVNRNGDVIENRIPETQSGQINEVFTLDNSIPSGAYLLKIRVGKNLYVRQVFYTKP